MKNNTKALLCAGMLVTIMVLPGVGTAAQYNSSTDTNANVLDYLEIGRAHV